MVSLMKWLTVLFYGVPGPGRILTTTDITEESLEYRASKLLADLSLEGS
jgi:hypothetical protein